MVQKMPINSLIPVFQGLTMKLKGNLSKAEFCRYETPYIFFYEWERRTGTSLPFSSLHPLRKGRGSQCQVI